VNKNRRLTGKRDRSPVFMQFWMTIGACCTIVFSLFFKCLIHNSLNQNNKDAVLIFTLP
ncbi:hypothetical protein ACJX0J_020365, partial [Zea mays]